MYVDDRAAKLVHPGNAGSAASQANPSYVDADDVASYFLMEDEYKKGAPVGSEGEAPIKNARGTRYHVWPMASPEIANDTQFFEKHGYQITTFWTVGAGIPTAPASGDTVWCYDTIVRVVGGRTGYTIDIPLRIIRET